ncbi:MAG: TolC family protein, partial [Tannerella sp.]|nr:TolC family protein [Tannerella sp.]
KNVSVAERSYSITLQRFTDGDIDSQALALERTRLNTAQRNHLDAFVNYRLQLADLMRQTFYDFENDVPIECGKSGCITGPAIAPLHWGL